MIKTDKWNFDDVDGEKMEDVMKFWDMGPMVVTGCTKVSEGCLRCWSETAHNRRCHNPAVEHLYRKELLTNGKFNGKVQFNLQQLEKAAKVKKPQVIAIWNDLYHEGVTDGQIIDAYNIMDAGAYPPKCMPHIILIITKRADRAATLYSEWCDEGLRHGADIPPNIWHLVTCENQARADERIPHLLRIPGNRGLLIEPCLGPVNIPDLKPHWECPQCGEWVIEHPGRECINRCGSYKKIHDIHQVILGPENAAGKIECPECKGSGLDVPFSTTNPNGIPCHRCEGTGTIPKARPFDPTWAESVKAQCEAAGVPFYRKDTGEGVLAWRQ